MTYFDADSQYEQARRAHVAWNLLLASAILILPVVILLPLAYAWRRKVYRTVYASHFRAVIRYAWVIFLTPLVAALVPWSAVGIVLALVAMFIVAFAAIEGRKAASRGMRYNGVLA